MPIDMHIYVFFSLKLSSVSRQNNDNYTANIVETLNWLWLDSIESRSPSPELKLHWRYENQVIFFYDI